MKQYHRFNTLGIITLLITVVFSITGTNSFGAQIEQTEVVDVADIWYARELI